MKVNSKPAINPPKVVTLAKARSGSVYKLKNPNTPGREMWRGMCAKIDGSNYMINLITGFSCSFSESMLFEEIEAEVTTE